MSMQKKNETILHDFAKRKMKKKPSYFCKKVYKAVNIMFQHHIHVLGTQNTDQLRLKSPALFEIQTKFQSSEYLQSKSLCHEIFHQSF